MPALKQLAGLLREVNRLNADVARLINRPALTGHLGEFIAAEVFGIRLADSATNAAVDGTFIGGPMAGKKVNIKCYPRLETLDIRPAMPPDCYLVLTGPRWKSGESRRMHRPFVISSVFLFERDPLFQDLNGRGVKLQTGTSIRRSLWDAAEIFPRVSDRYPLTAVQRKQLELFAPVDA